MPTLTNEELSGVLCRFGVTNDQENFRRLIDGGKIDNKTFGRRLHYSTGHRRATGEIMRILAARHRKEVA